MRVPAILVAALIGCSTGVQAAEKIAVAVEGQTLSIELYPPATGTAPRGTIVLGSGDVGWVGLAADLAGFLSSQGYAVAGINIRQYLSAFTSRDSHLTPPQVPRHYAVIVDALRARKFLWSPLVVAGVSEGAALAVLAAADDGNHRWIDGVIAIGLPRSAELAWRWTDAVTWLTKKEPDEPSFLPLLFVPRVSPVPLWMIQSAKDEYTSPADAAAFEREARPPSRFVRIDASNHRFTDRIPELRQQVLAGLAWIRNPASDAAPRTP